MFSNCNPCNIRYSNKTHWIGQVGQHNGFASFSSCYYGYRAFLVLCRTYYRKYHITTVSAFLQKYAPCTENNTSAYIDFVVSNLAKHNLNCDFDLSRNRLYWLAYYVTKFENGSVPFDVLEQLKKAVDTYILYL